MNRYARKKPAAPAAQLYELPDVYEPCCSLLRDICGTENVYRFAQRRPTNQSPGPGDLFFVAPWKVAGWVECKRPGGKQREAQRQLMRSLDGTGVEYWLVDNAQDLAYRLAASRHSVWGGAREFDPMREVKAILSAQVVADIDKRITEGSGNG